MKPCLVVAACLLYCAPAHAATRVYAEAGNVQIERDGVKATLTKSGRDTEPVLSPDGRFVVFTREPEKKSEDECRDGANADLLMRIGTGSGRTAAAKRPWCAAVPATNRKSGSAASPPSSSIRTAACFIS
jgi:hypothetical protein